MIHNCYSKHDSQMLLKKCSIDVTQNGPQALLKVVDTCYSKKMIRKCYLKIIKKRHL